ncbi:MAG TPA: hypothetical protein VNV44_03850 [Solirubrobacteraceae bacterium]|nr:hypothetical protein [Solirubrobacteraceae bacterium]
MSLASQSRALAASVALAAVPLAWVLEGEAAAAPAPSPRPGSEAALMQSLLRSRELWATIDVCSPADEQNYVGVRGSMPGDRHAHDKMYMRFRLEYMNTTKKTWADLTSATSPTFVYVGPGSGVRQGGRSFQLVPRTGKPAVMLRGVVEYQWRRGKTVVQSTSRATGPGHKSVAGADPPGYSSATCSIG